MQPNMLNCSFNSLGQICEGHVIFIHVTIRRTRAVFVPLIHCDEAGSCFYQRPPEWTSLFIFSVYRNTLVSLHFRRVELKAFIVKSSVSRVISCPDISLSDVSSFSLDETWWHLQKSAQKNWPKSSTFDPQTSFKFLSLCMLTSQCLN